MNLHQLPELTLVIQPDGALSLLQEAPLKAPWRSKTVSLSRRKMLVQADPVLSTDNHNPTASSFCGRPVYGPVIILPEYGRN